MSGTIKHGENSVSSVPYFTYAINTFTSSMNKTRPAYYSNRVFSNYTTYRNLGLWELLSFSKSQIESKISFNLAKLNAEIDEIRDNAITAIKTSSKNKTDLSSTSRSLTKLISDILLLLLESSDRKVQIEYLQALLIKVNKILKLLVIPSLKQVIDQDDTFSSKSKIETIFDLVQIIFSLADPFNNVHSQLNSHGNESNQVFIIESNLVIDILDLSKSLQLKFEKNKNRLSLYDNNKLITNTLLLVIEEKSQSMQALIDIVIHNCLPTLIIFDYFTNLSLQTPIEIKDVELLKDFLVHFKMLNEYFDQIMDSSFFQTQKKLIKGSFHDFLVNFQKISPNFNNTKDDPLAIFAGLYEEIYNENSNVISGTVVKKKDFIESASQDINNYHYHLNQKRPLNRNSKHFHDFDFRSLEPNYGDIFSSVSDLSTAPGPYVESLYEPTERDNYDSDVDFTKLYHEKENLREPESIIANLIEGNEQILDSKLDTSSVKSNCKRGFGIDSNFMPAKVSDLKENDEKNDLFVSRVEEGKKKQQNFRREVNSAGDCYNSGDLSSVDFYAATGSALFKRHSFAIGIGTVGSLDPVNPEENKFKRYSLDAGIATSFGMGQGIVSAIKSANETSAIEKKTNSNKNAHKTQSQCISIDNNFKTDLISAYVSGDYGDSSTEVLSKNSDIGGDVIPGTNFNILGSGTENSGQVDMDEPTDNQYLAPSLNRQLSQLGLGIGPSNDNQDRSNEQKYETDSAKVEGKNEKLDKLNVKMVGRVDQNNHEPLNKCDGFKLTNDSKFFQDYDSLALEPSFGDDHFSVLSDSNFGPISKHVDSIYIHANKAKCKSNSLTDVQREDLVIDPEKKSRTHSNVAKIDGIDNTSLRSAIKLKNKDSKKKDGLQDNILNFKATKQLQNKNNKKTSHKNTLLLPIPHQKKSGKADGLIVADVKSSKYVAEEVKNENKIEKKSKLKFVYKDDNCKKCKYIPWHRHTIPKK